MGVRPPELTSGRKNGGSGEVIPRCPDAAAKLGPPVLLLLHSQREREKDWTESGGVRGGESTSR